MDSNTDTKESLKSKINTLKIVTGVLVGVLFVLLAICIYGLLVKEDKGVFRALITVPIVLTTIVFVNAQNIKKMKSQLDSSQ